jgi:RNA polymerase sigma-70 factor (ECF subfamily)
MAGVGSVARALQSGAAMTLEPSDAPVPTLEQLMAEVADGSDAAFTALYRRMAPRLAGHLNRLCRDPALVEDAVQNAFAKVHRARGGYLRGAAVVPWVLVIARRALYDELRAARARGEVLSDTGVLPERPVEDGLSLDEARHLERALALLPGQYREAIELTKLHGLSGGEAARVLATTESAIKLRVHRGYRMLRERFEAEAA